MIWSYWQKENVSGCLLYHVQWFNDYTLYLILCSPSIHGACSRPLLVLCKGANSNFWDVSNGNVLFD